VQHRLIAPDAGRLLGAAIAVIEHLAAPFHIDTHLFALVFVFSVLSALEAQAGGYKHVYHVPSLGLALSEPNKNFGHP
jgi:hypothetical protein